MVPQIFIYLAQVTAYTGGCWLIYRLLLRNKPLHGWNRGFLLLSVLLPVILPFGALPLPEGVLPGPAVVRLSRVTVGSPAMPAGRQGQVPWLLYLYLGVAAALMARMAIHYFGMRRRLRRHAALHQGFRLVYNTGIGPGTFGCTVFLPGTAADPSVLSHELAHIRLRHRYDLLLTGAFQCLYWPNVFLYLLVEELRMVHEFQADAAACRQDQAGYTQQLLRHVFGTAVFPLASTFFHQPIKRRIMMLQQSDRHLRRLPLSLAALGLALLLSAVTLWAQSGRGPQEPAVGLAPAGDNAGASAAPTQVPQFNGDLMAFLSRRLQYPPEAYRVNQQGLVTIKFVVDEQGMVSQAEVAHSSGKPVLDQEALRVVNGMPRWKPGTKDGKPVSVSYFIPIEFRRSPLFLPATKIFGPGEGC